MSAAILGKLRTVRTNFCGALLVSCLIRRMSREEISTKGRVIVGEDGFYCVPHGKDIPAEAGDYYELALGGTEKGRQHAALEVAKMALRNLTQDSYEALFDYCETTRQLAQMQSQPWYQFARVMRHSLTHTQYFKFHPRVRSILPVTWSGKTIEPSMDGQEVPFTFFDWHDGLELFEEMYSFAKTLK